jgi:uncharacterized membrane protein YoaK (UPF0700 family)
MHQSTVARVPREETLHVAVLLAAVGGYLEAYTWIVHRVFANAQTANLIFLWVYATAGEWQKALYYVPPLLAFCLGVIMASYLRLLAGANAARISLLLEVVFLFVVAVLHNRVPELAGTLGISFVAAMQTASFPKVEEWTYSSVMATSNFRHTIEGLFAALAATSGINRFRRPRVFGAICVAFGGGAALGALITKEMPAYALAIPVVILLGALVRCELGARMPSDEHRRGLI